MAVHTIPFRYQGLEIPNTPFAATLNPIITMENTLIQVAVTAAITDFSLSNGRGMEPGTKVKIDITQDATGRNVAFGATGESIVAPDLVGVANDRDTIELMWDGSAWVGGVWQKVVDAA